MLLIPNILTLTRIAFIPIYITLFLHEYYIASSIIFMISALTDLLDGYIARNFDMQSKIGKILDPLADKLTVISVLIVLLFVNLVPKPILIILLSREILIFTSSAIAYFLGKNFINPTRLGKISITFIYVAIAALLLDKKILANIILYITIPLNITSAIDYIISAVKKI